MLATSAKISKTNYWIKHSDVFLISQLISQLIPHSPGNKQGKEINNETMKQRNNETRKQGNKPQPSYAPGA